MPTRTRFSSTITSSRTRSNARSGRRIGGGVFKFAFTRNPWDRAVSLYHFILSDPSHAAHEATRHLSFAEYLHVYNEKSKSRQTDWTHLGDRQIVDFIGRFENLSADFATICATIGIAGHRLPRLNTSRHASYRDYYDDAMRESVAQSRRREIELYGYAF